LPQARRVAFPVESVSMTSLPSHIFYRGVAPPFDNATYEWNSYAILPDDAGYRRFHHTPVRPDSTS